MQKDKEDLEEVSTELELADEDELVPYVCRFLSICLCACLTAQIQNRRYLHPAPPPRRPGAAGVVDRGHRLGGDAAGGVAGRAARRVAGVEGCAVCAVWAEY